MLTSYHHYPRRLSYHHHRLSCKDRSHPRGICARPGARPRPSPCLHWQERKRPRANPADPVGERRQGLCDLFQGYRSCCHYQRQCQCQCQCQWFNWWWCRCHYERQRKEISTIHQRPIQRRISGGPSRHHHPLHPPLPSSHQRTAPG